MEKYLRLISIMVIIFLHCTFFNASAKTYTISITSKGNGAVQFDNEIYWGKIIRESTIVYSLEENSPYRVATLQDYGYKVKNIVINGKLLESRFFMASQYVLDSDTKIEVEYEINPVVKYEGRSFDQHFTALGNGMIYINGESIRNSSKTYKFYDNINVEPEFFIIPDKGYKIKSLTFNGKEAANDYEKYLNTTYFSTLCSNPMSIFVEFEVDPSQNTNIEPVSSETNYILSIISSGSGYVSYNGTTLRDTSSSFTVSKGANVTISIIPDTDSYINNVKLNNTYVSVIGSNYTIYNIVSDTKVEVTFAVQDKSLSYEGINYEVSSFDNHTAYLADGNYGELIEVPEQITAQNATWKINGVKENALANNTQLAAIIWNPAFAFNTSVSNPNLLLYVKDASYAPSTINNVVVNGVANKITLTDSNNGNNFYCPQEFTATSISYTHSYNMTTGFNESRGWETIALPFDVQKITHGSRGDLIPYTNWIVTSPTKPFWLYKLSINGFIAADGIKAYTPYIISMPNNSNYVSDFRLNGSVTFSAENVKIAKSDNVQRASYNGKTFIPNFENQLSNASIYALNVNNDLETYNGTESEGSVFISNLRSIHPFEAYMTSNSGTRSIGIFDDMTTAVDDITIMNEDKGEFKVYDLKGILIRKASSIEEAKKDLPAGMYLINNKKFIIK